MITVQAHEEPENKNFPTVELPGYTVQKGDLVYYSTPRGLIVPAQVVKIVDDVPIRVQIKFTASRAGAMFRRKETVWMDRTDGSLHSRDAVKMTNGSRGFIIGRTIPVPDNLIGTEIHLYKVQTGNNHSKYKTIFETTNSAVANVRYNAIFVEDGHKKRIMLKGAVVKRQTTTMLGPRYCRDCGDEFRTSRPDTGSKWSNLCTSCLQWHV